MNAHSRRQFVKRSAAGMLALGTCNSLAFGQGSAQRAKMAIARWGGSGTPPADRVDRIAAEMTRKAIAALGGMERFVRRQDVVWVKPNIGWDRSPELAANTNPAVVETLVRLCYEAGAKKVKVGDNPCDLARNSYANSGIADAARRAGAEVVFLDRRRFKTVAIKGQRVKKLPMYPEVLDCDLVISAAVAKHHALATATLCMKNYMGVIEQRRTFHQAIPECLADLTRFMRPQLCVLDAVRVLLRHGPKGGNPADVAMPMTVAAGVDIVAMDAFGAELLGRKPEEVGSVVVGQRAGLGTKDYRSLAPKEIVVS